MIGEIAVTNIGYAGLWDAYIKRMNRVGEEGPKITEDALVRKSSEEERKKVTAICNAQGKIVKGDDRSAQEKIMRYNQLRRLIDTFA